MQEVYYIQKERLIRDANLAVLILAYSLIVCLLSLTGCSSPGSAREGVDQTTPEATALSFYQAINRQDVALLKMLIDKDDENAEPVVKAFEALA